MAISSQGTTFTFPGFTALYTSISVEEPEAEVVDMTRIDDPAGVRRMVSTGDVTSPATVRVDYIRLAGTPSPLAISGLSGQLVISHPNISVSKKAVLQSATSEIAVGDVLRGTLNFVIDNST
jgi:hypothetical protein